MSGTSAGQATEADERAGVERLHELLVAAARNRGLRGEQADAPVAGRLDGGVGLRLEDADDRHRQLLLELRERRRGRGVARGDDELHALALQEARDLAGEAPDLVGRPRPVRKARTVADVHEVLVRERDEALVEDGQPAHAGVEHAERPRIHQAIVRAGRYPSRAVRRTLLPLPRSCSARLARRRRGVDEAGRDDPGERRATAGGDALRAGRSRARRAAGRRS